jgi:hypothetical protein
MKPTPPLKIKVCVKRINFTHEQWEKEFNGFMDEYDCEAKQIKDTYWLITTTNGHERLLTMQDELRVQGKTILIEIVKNGI